MVRTSSARRPIAVATVGLFAATLLSGCFGSLPVVVPTPTSTGFAGIGGDPQPIETSDPVTPTDPANAGATWVTDDYNVLQVQVPVGWTDVDGSSFTTDDGQEWASIVASTDIATYFSNYKVSGMELAGSPLPDGVTSDQLKNFLDSVTNYFLADCDIIQQGEGYDDGYYVGFQSGFENCAGTDTKGFGIVAIDNAGKHVLFLRAQIASPDDPGTVYNILTGSFQSTITRGAAK